MDIILTMEKLILSGSIIPKNVSEIPPTDGKKPLFSILENMVMIGL